MTEAFSPDLSPANWPPVAHAEVAPKVLAHFACKGLLSIIHGRSAGETNLRGDSVFLSGRQCCGQRFSEHASSISWPLVPI